MGLDPDLRSHFTMDFALFDKPDPTDGPFFEETIYVTPLRQEACSPVPYGWM